jgi:hypothetical protein
MRRKLEVQTILLERCCDKGGITCMLLDILASSIQRPWEL